MAVSASQCLKTLLVEGSEEGSVVALVIRGDHDLNEIKAEKHPLIATPLTFSTPEQVTEACGANIGSIGPAGLTIPVIVDRTAAHTADFVCGANQNGQHFSGVNWGRDLPEPEIADLRNVVAGDPSPDGKGLLDIARGIEVGHIFQLGDNYSQKLNANVLAESGKAQLLTMGCYGIGVSRVVAAAIEQHHDDRGIIWPLALAPFQVVLVPINAHKSIRLREAAEALYQQLFDAGFDILFDDRGQRPGVAFADMDLIGIPHRLILGERGLDKGMVEYKCRADGSDAEFAIADVIEQLTQRMEA
jgi:prolyl-tRNA synthetase